ADALGSALPEKRALPEVLARYVAAPEELTLAQVAAVPLLGVPVMALMSFAVNEFNTTAAYTILFSVPFLAFLIRRFDLLRRACKRGYGIRDLRMALDPASAVHDSEQIGSTSAARRIHDAAHTLAGVVPLAIILLVIGPWRRLEPTELLLLAYAGLYALGS